MQSFKFVFCLFVLASCGVSKQHLQQGLVAYYPMDGDAQDHSGNNFHAENKGAVSSSNRFQEPGKAFFLDGANDYILLPSTQLNMAKLLQNEGAISLWYKSEDAKGDIIQFFEAGAGEDGFALRYLNQAYSNAQNRLFFIMGSSVGDNTANWIIKYNIDPTKWHSITATWNPNQMKLYFDGVLVGFLPKLKIEKFHAQPSNFAIGVYEDLRSLFFKGAVDEVYIHQRELSEEEVHWLHR